MVYRDWTITTYSTFLGYLVQYVSPIGTAHHTSPYFPTDDQAVAYAQTRIDYLLECERCQLENSKTAPTPCG
jgi:hypothetical protein